ncbi:unnamed protein product [Psylliodes chrysocephalus]|uniref:Uncharacterized protein n=1 Tax=Psylliodes chrysocephalus TaxID=3402493 RepID=A0A9P0G757_9CUCU|nr:unnamed protein product [Psylliodes chrysocephala]
MPVEFDDIAISDEVVLLDDGAGGSFLVNDNTTIATTESTETVGMTNDLNIQNKGTDESVLNQNDIKIKDDRLMEHNEGRHSQEAFRVKEVCQIRTKEISEISDNVILDNSDKLVKTEEHAKDNNSVVTQKTDESLNTKVDNKLDSGIKENSKENIEVKNTKTNILTDVCINLFLWDKHLTMNDYNKTATDAQKITKTYMPYAVTSKTFKEYCKQKEETKKQNAQEVDNQKLQRTLNKLKKKLKKTNKTNKKEKVSTKENNNIFSRRKRTKTISKTKKNKAVIGKRDKKYFNGDELPLANPQDKYNVGDCHWCSFTPNRVSETSALDSDQLHNIPTASCSTTAQIEAESNTDVSFEKLLLATMKNHTSYEKVKKKRLQTAKKKNEKKSKIDSSDDEENADNFSLHSSSKEASLSTLLRKEVEERQEEEEEEAFKPLGDWAIVKFCTKKSVKYFMGNILSFNDYGEAVVSYVRKASDHAGITTFHFLSQKDIVHVIFHFLSQEDITDVMEDDIISILPKPTIRRRGEVIFSVGFSQYNIQ